MSKEDLLEVYEQDPFELHNYMALDFVEKDSAGFHMTIQPESKNAQGMVHGGAIYTLADNAAGTAAHTDYRRYVTQHGDLHFLRNQTEGTIRAIGRVRHRGGTTCLVDVDVLGENDQLLATGEFTYFCVKKDRT